MPLSKSAILRILLIQEIRNILLSPALWGLLIFLSILVGYSFIQAVSLFGQASQTALLYPELAAGMNPLQGIFVPTFGAYYLVETLLLPFVVIRLIGQDKQSGALKLLLQLPVSTFALNGVKLVAMFVVWLLFLLPAVSVLLNWILLGGVIHLPEIGTLLLGHALYSLAIICVAMFATAVSGNLPTAAMLCLGTTLGCWVLDFAVANGHGWLGTLDNWSLTTLLRQFESGLFSLAAVLSFLFIALLFFVTAAVWLHPGKQPMQKIKTMLLMVVLFVPMAIGISSLDMYIDLTENQSHSFNPADVRALKQMSQPLTITVHLSMEDGRFYDLQHEVLQKLRRVVPDLRLVFADTETAGLFAASESDTYGLIEYDYGGKHQQSYSNSPLEILPLLHELAGHKILPDPVRNYVGHPLVADARGSRWWFYLLLPLLFLFAAGLVRKR